MSEKMPRLNLKENLYLSRTSKSITNNFLKQHSQSQSFFANGGQPLVLVEEKKLSSNELKRTELDIIDGFAFLTTLANPELVDTSVDQEYLALYFSKLQSNQILNGEVQQQLCLEDESKLTTLIGNKIAISMVYFPDDSCFIAVKHNADHSFRHLLPYIKQEAYSDGVTRFKQDITYELDNVTYNTTVQGTYYVNSEHYLIKIICKYLNQIFTTIPTVQLSNGRTDFDSVISSHLLKSLGTVALQMITTDTISTRKEVYTLTALSLLGQDRHLTFNHLFAMINMIPNVTPDENWIQPKRAENGTFSFTSLSSVSQIHKYNPVTVTDFQAKQETRVGTITGVSSSTFDLFN